MSAGWRPGRAPPRAWAATVVLTLAAAVAAAGPAAHGRDYWLALRAHKFLAAPAEPLLPLALEATRLLGSTDPVLRDEVGYESLVAWIYTEPRLTPAELDAVRAELVANATRGLGEAGSDGLFLRSFSLLALSVMAAADLRQPLLSPADFDALLELGTTVLARERDLRGYVPGKGWGHATAHGADLLRFLARSGHLAPAQQARIVEAIAGRLQSAGLVFVWGEDERLAAALASVARRPDADPAPFRRWCGRLAADNATLWTGAFDPARYVAVRAQLNALAALAADLESDATPGGTQAIRAALRELRAATQ